MINPGIQPGGAGDRRQAAPAINNCGKVLYGAITQNNEQEFQTGSTGRSARSTALHPQHGTSFPGSRRRIR